MWQIFPENDRILFVTETAIYSWTENHFRVIPREGEIHRANQDLYFRVQGKGMYRLIGEVLEPIPDGEKLQNIRIDVVLPYRNRSVLFASWESGIFVFDGKTVAKFENGVDDFIIRNNLYTGLILSDSSYVFGTLRGGVIMMDKYGNAPKRSQRKKVF